MGKIKLLFELADGPQLLNIDDTLTMKTILDELINTGLIYNPYGDFQIWAHTYDDNGHEKVINEKKKISDLELHDNTVIGFSFDHAASDCGLFQELWTLIYPYLDQTATIIGIGGATINVVSWLRRKFRYQYPTDVIDVLTKNSSWHALDLAQTLNITEDQAKTILKAFGYKWDRRHLVYVESKTTKEIVENIRKALHRNYGL